MVISYSEKQRSDIHFRLILDYKSKVIDWFFFRFIIFVNLSVATYSLLYIYHL